MISGLKEDFKDFALEWGQDEAEKTLIEFINQNVRPKAAAALKLILNKVNLLSSGAEFGGGAAALIVADVKGEFDGNPLERLKLWGQALNEAFNPFVNTTAAVLEGGLKLGEAAFHSAIDVIIRAAVQPLLTLHRMLGAGTAGNDTYDGTGRPDFIFLKQGNDTAYGNGGNDFMVGGSGEGDDLYDGGSGLDEVTYSSASNGLNIDLAAGTAQGPGIGIDTLHSIENATGGTGDDTISGNAAHNHLSGDSGNDIVTGKDGNDTLEGGAGADQLSGGAGLDLLVGGAEDDLLSGQGRSDTLVGGAGKDSLTGGIGADQFEFDAVNETRGAKRDVITDFSSVQSDKIYLSTIDADINLGGDQAFTFIGTAEFTAPGQVRAVQSGANTIVSLSNDADTSPEMAFTLTGRFTLTEGDFAL